jgi:hypothetical protein
MIDLRPEVQAFAEAMELKLRQNDHKGGWKDSNFHYLDGKIHIELLEMERAFWCLLGDKENKEKLVALCLECADIANFAMMIADSHGALDISKLQEAKEVKSKSQ